MLVRQKPRPPRFEVDAPPYTSVPSRARRSASVAPPPRVSPRRPPRFRVEATPSPPRRVLRSSALWMRRRRLWRPRRFSLMLPLRALWRRRIAVAALLAVVLVLAGVARVFLIHPTPSTARHAAAPLASVQVSGPQGPELRSELGALVRPQPPFPALHVNVPNAATPAPGVQAQAAFLFDPDTSSILFQKNANDQHPVASLAKIMTLLAAVYNGNLDQTVTVGPDAAALVNSNNSYMGVSAGERLTVRQLLYGLIVASGNDAAVALADQVSGSTPAFVTLMNHRARLLGLDQTVFVSPDGADDGNLSSARDIAVLSAVALQQPGVEQITATLHYSLPQSSDHKAYDMTSTNSLLPGGSAAYPGAIGVKTGYTPASGYSLAFAARIQGHLLVGAVLDEPSDATRLADARALLTWAATQEGASAP